MIIDGYEPSWDDGIKKKEESKFSLKRQSKGEMSESLRENKLFSLFPKKQKHKSN